MQVPLSACSSDQSCPAADYMTCWETPEAMSDDSYDSEDSYDSYGEVDGRPECFDYDDSGDYEEWCAWNDVDEDVGYYVPFQLDVAGEDVFIRDCVDLDTVVADSVVHEPTTTGFGRGVASGYRL